MSGPLRTLITLLATAGLLLLGMPALAVDEVDDFASLPFTGYGDMLVDSAHGQVFVTGGYGSNEIAVVALDGSGVTMVPGTPGATNLSMTPDGQTVYASLVNADAVAEIDTTTLATRRIPTGPGSCPQDLVALAGYVWFVEGDSFCGQWTQIRRLDPATGSVSPDVATTNVYNPMLSAVPGTTKFVFAEVGISTARVGVYDVADGTLNRTGGGSVDGYLDRSARLTNDGEHLMVSRSGSVNFYRVADSSADGISAVPGGRQPAAAAADDDVVVVAPRDSNRVSVLPRGASGVLNAIDLGPTGSKVVDLELVGDQMFAVTQGQTLRLFQVPQPAVPAPALTLQVPSESVFDRPITVSGTLSDQGAPLAGELVTVRRDDSREVLGTATTDADGRYSLELPPQEIGPHAITARFAGNDTVKAATRRALLNVVGRPVTLTLSGPESVEPGAPVTLTGSLSDEEGPMHDVSLSVERRCEDSSYGDSLEAVTTAADGTFSTTDSPGSCASYTYVVEYAGDESRAARSAMTTVAVNWVSPTIELTGPTGVAAVGGTIRIAGTMRTADGPVTGTDLTAQVTTPEGPRNLGPLTTDDSGRFELSDTPTAEGEHCYTVAFDGDARTHPASDTFCVWASKWPTYMTLSGPNSAHLDDPVVLTGQLTTSQAEPLVGVDVKVSRTDDFGTQALPTIVTGADGRFTLRDVPPNGGWVTYGLSTASTATRGGVSRSWSVSVSRPTPTLELQTDRLTYAYGQTAQILVDLETNSSRTVEVFAQEAGRGEVRIFSGEVPDAGLTVEYPMRRNTDFSALVREDGRALAAFTKVSRLTRSGVTTKPLGSYGSAGRYALYRPAANPRFVATVSPVRTQGFCLFFDLQRHTASGWRTVSQSPCATESDGNTATWRLTGTRQTGTPYRVQPTLPADSSNAETKGSWTYFKFVKTP